MSITTSRTARWMHNGDTHHHLHPNLITSTKSNTVKTIQALLTKRKKRTELSATVVEGPRIVMDLLANPKTRPLIQNVLVSIDNQNDWYAQLRATYPDLQVSEGTDEVLQACSDTVTPQGIVAVISIPNSSSTTETISPLSHPLYLVLDGVSDPGNVGTLLRSCVAVGVAGVVLLPNCCDVWNPKAVRSAMGCSFQVPIVAMDSIEEAQEFLDRNHVLDVYCATMEKSESGDESLPHYDVDWVGRPSALVIGSEGTGLSESVRKALSRGNVKAVHVPMEAGIESLNAAVCGSVILFEYLRQSRTRVQSES